MDQMYKCGYCGWVLQLHCENVLEHSCLKNKFIEGEHDVVEDDMKVLTIVNKTTNETVGASQVQLSFEERIIKYVQDRPALYNFGLPLSERTNSKKAALWREIANLFGGQYAVEDIQKKWKYLRDSYIRAKKKVTTYKPSGSGASAQPDPGFKFYEAMQFVDDCITSTTSQSTVCSLLQPATLQPTASTSTASTSRGQGQSPSTSGSHVTTPLTSPDDLMSPQSKKRKQSETESQILAALMAPPQKLDGVDGFLLRLGESLRKLPYRERSQLEFKIMSLVFETENTLYE